MAHHFWMGEVKKIIKRKKKKKQVSLLPFTIAAAVASEWNWLCTSGIVPSFDIESEGFSLPVIYCDNCRKMRLYTSSHSLSRCDFKRNPLSVFLKVRSSYNNIMPHVIGETAKMMHHVLLSPFYRHSIRAHTEHYHRKLRYRHQYLILQS